MNLTLCVVIMRHFKNKKIYGITFNLLFVARIRDVGLSMYSLKIYIFKRKNLFVMKKWQCNKTDEET